MSNLPKFSRALLHPRYWLLWLGIGFLAAGLFWSLLADAPFATSIANFFLGCVLIAGIYGGLTASKKITNDMNSTELYNRYISEQAAGGGSGDV
ncbi:DUF1304 family protein, partial [Klebsiella pneumoniae]